MIDASDPIRLGLPSASAYPRLDACLGSGQLERKCADVDTSDDDSRSGDAVHLGLKNQSTDGLSDSEFEVYEKANEITGRLEAEFVQDGLEYRTLREERMWLRRGIVPVFSGQADYLMIDSESTHCLCLDFKSLWGHHTPSEDNLQLEALCVLAKVKWPTLVQFTGAIVQPRKSMHPTLVTFDEEAMRLALGKLVATLQAAEQPNPPLVVGVAQCRYCRGKLVCPALAEHVEQTRLALASDFEVLPARDADTKTAIREHVSRLSGEELASRAKQRSLLVFLAAALADEAKARLSLDASSVPGFALSQGRKQTTILDSKKAIRLCKPHVKPSDIEEATTLSLPKLADAFYKHGDLTKLEARRQIEALLEPVLSRTTTASQLVEIKDTQTTIE